METQGNAVKALQILYKALLAGQLLFAIMVILLFARGILSPAITNPAATIFFYVAIGLSVAATAFSYKLFAQKLEEAKQQKTPTEKFNGYRAALILQLGLCEMPALFVIICYFLTGNKMLLALLILLLLNFARLYPIRSKIIQQLELDQDAESVLD